ncbi:hypothetical protein ABW20_dc0103651 [Dactylellina cionopaga]|nr:hypothetical protein ABW20_dc0103651 [Dactylellina cionopaga]
MESDPVIALQWHLMPKVCTAEKATTGQEVTPIHGYSQKEEDVQMKEYKPETRAECWEDSRRQPHVYGDLDELRETANAFCHLFDAHIYEFAQNTAVKDIREFSLGTVYHAVGLGDKKNMRVNFQFIFAPRSYRDGKYWYSLSLFTGIPNLCNVILTNFLSEDTAPSKAGGNSVNCVGGSGKDTVGGWAGMNIGDVKAKDFNFYYFRWAVDPYVRDSKHGTPMKYPDDNKDNGLPGTDPAVTGDGFKPLKIGLK